MLTATFGPFLFDGGRRQLFRGQASVPLPSRIFDLLELLITEAPRVVHKDAIVDAVWRDTYVSDASISMAVTQLRKALGDSADQPTFIRTVHGHGYAFIASVERVATRDGGARPKFRIIVGDRRVLLDDGETLVGRDPASGIWIDRDSVSWRHARVIVDGAAAAIEDLGSLNGTYVDGKKISGRTPLHPGGAIRVADVDVTLEDASRAPSSPTKRIP
jgi:DNA-binding winged helix-turn-helix (wHTH) protein